MKYKDEHLKIFTACNIEWPPQYGDSSEVLDGSQMYVRGHEIAFFMHHNYPPTAANHKGDSMQFIDGNISLKRLVSFEEAGGKLGAKDPWCSNCPSLTSKSQIICRWLDWNLKVVKVYQLSGKELMFMIGWPRARQDELLPYDYDQLAALAGGAFNGFSILPVVSALIYGAHMAGLNGNDDIELSGVDKAKLSKVQNRQAVKKEEAVDATKGKTKAKAKAKEVLIGTKAVRARASAASSRDAPTNSPPSKSSSSSSSNSSSSSDSD